MSPPDLGRLAFFLVAGAAVGAGGLATLRLNTALYAGGAVWRPVALHLVRLAALAAAFVWAAHQGAWPLLGAFGCFAAVRPLLVPVLARFG